MSDHRQRRHRQEDSVLDRMRQDGWAVAPAISPTTSFEVNIHDSREQEATKQHEGWQIWQRVVDATSESMHGVASAVRSKVNTEDRLYGKTLLILFLQGV